MYEGVRYRRLKEATNERSSTSPSLEVLSLNCLKIMSNMRVRPHRNRIICAVVSVLVGTALLIAYYSSSVQDVVFLNPAEKKLRDFRYRTNDKTAELSPHVKLNHFLQSHNVDSEFNILKVAGRKQSAINENFGYSSLMSDHIGNDIRPLPETRPQACLMAGYPFQAERVVVVMIFKDELPSVVLRSVASVVERTPEDMLERLIIVDDMSKEVTARLDIIYYLSKRLPLKYSVLVSDGPSGIVPARLLAIKTARDYFKSKYKLKGAADFAVWAKEAYIAFLDAQVEVNDGWLEPLIRNLAERNNTGLAMPTIDTIDAITFEYKAGDPLAMRGAFDWGMRFKWLPLLDESSGSAGLPIRNPVISGGLFLVNWFYFDDIGLFDGDMVGWGCEQVELSIRTWLCDGRSASGNLNDNQATVDKIQIVPCSRVGHVFRRNKPPGRKSEDEEFNCLRAARVWFDQDNLLKTRYFHSRPHASNMHFGDLGHRQTLRTELHCKPFSWFIDNVLPSLKQVPTDWLQEDEQGELETEAAGQLESPVKKYSYSRAGLLVHHNTGLCVTTESGQTASSVSSYLTLQTCNKKDTNHMWYETREGNKLIMSRMSCLSYVMGLKQRLLAIIDRCKDDSEKQSWTWLDHLGASRLAPKEDLTLCLSPARKKDGNNEVQVLMEMCRPDHSQEFELLSV